jgi:SPW repeat
MRRAGRKISGFERGAYTLKDKPTSTSFWNRMAAFWNRMPVRGANMVTTAFSPPKRCEDWVSVVLGLWLFASRWVLQYGEITATQNAVLVGFLLIAIEFVEFSAFRVWEEWINVILGAWLVAWPWVLGAALMPTVNFVIVGLLVLGLALYEIWDERRHSTHPA